MFSHTAGGRVQGQGDATTPAPPADGAYQPVNRYFTVESPVPRSHQHQHLPRSGFYTLELSTNLREVSQCPDNAPTKAYSRLQGSWLSKPPIDYDLYRQESQVHVNLPCLIACSA